MTLYHGPSPAQEETLRFIVDWLDRYDFQPTYREISAKFGGISTNAVSDRLKGLRRKGYIKMNAKARGITITKKAKRFLERTEVSS